MKVLWVFTSILGRTDSNHRKNNSLVCQNAQVNELTAIDRITESCSKNEVKLPKVSVGDLADSGILYLDTLIRTDVIVNRTAGQTWSPHIQGGPSHMLVGCQRQNLFYFELRDIWSSSTRVNLKSCEEVQSFPFKEAEINSAIIIVRLSLNFSSELTQYVWNPS
jgi:hypothetical protein